MKYIIFEDASVVNIYRVEAESEDDARRMVNDGDVSPDEQDFKEFEITEVVSND